MAAMFDYEKVRTLPQHRAYKIGILKDFGVTITEDISKEFDQCTSEAQCDALARRILGVGSFGIPFRSARVHYYKDDEQE